ncbi:MAG: cyclic nucleotide-binding domain-containing protein [Kofleriaceae bacterium]|nr:cyclic nucleotide-binding domain-containing protein [Kofleriaceae bacterium]
MATISELKEHGLKLFVSGKYIPALQIYDAIVAQQPLDLEARIRVADCLAALGESKAAERVYRAAGWYAIKSGHALCALVVAKILQESGGVADDLLTGLVMNYGRESELIGNYAARINSPSEDIDIQAPDLQAGPAADLQASAGECAATCTDTFDEYPEVLHPIPLLSGLSEDAFRRVMATVVVRRMADGQHAIVEGEAGESFFMVASGQVRVYRKGTSGESEEIATLSENAVFGEMALLSNQPRSASVVVVGEADLIELTRSSLHSIADELSQVATALHEFTHERLLENLMARSPLFAPFTPVEQRDLLRRFSEHDVAAETEIIAEGDEGRGIFVVLSGQLSVIRGQDLLLATMKTGDVFGEIAVVQKCPTTASVVTDIPSTVLFLGAEYVERMMQGVPAIKQYLETLAKDRVMDTQLTIG